MNLFSPALPGLELLAGNALCWQNSNTVAPVPTGAALVYPASASGLITPSIFSILAEQTPHPSLYNAHSRLGHRHVSSGYGTILGPF